MPVNSNGYVYEVRRGHPVADKYGRVLQHRLVWFEAHGSIPDGGVIHHINGDKADNRLENLELCDASSHMKKHYPRGFTTISWNMGTARYERAVCSSCGAPFIRKAKEINNTTRRGRRLACSVQCTGAKKGQSALGWTMHRTGKFQAQRGGKYLGLFATQAEAEQAYKNAGGTP